MNPQIVWFLVVWGLVCLLLMHILTKARLTRAACPTFMLTRMWCFSSWVFTSASRFHNTDIPSRPSHPKASGFALSHPYELATIYWHTLANVKWFAAIKLHLNIFCRWKNSCILTNLVETFYFWFMDILPLQWGELITGCILWSRLELLWSGRSV